MGKNKNNELHPEGSKKLPLSDALPQNIVDRIAPDWILHYLRLGRFDRPIGAWLLLWPAWWSVALASREAPVGWRWAVTGAGAIAEGLPDPILLLMFLIGAFAMRAAGCTYNDIIDRKIDAKVTRTASRPIPSGKVSIFSASIFSLFLGLVGLLVLLTFNSFAILLGLSLLLLIIVYPFAKRITYWPQLLLGFTFNWGALLGWAAVTGEISLAAFSIYIGGIFWTLGYDTIYAHTDKNDDINLGIKSSAIALGEKTKPALIFFYFMTLTGIIISAILSNLLLVPFLIVLIAAITQLLWQVIDLDVNDPKNCLSKFRSNHIFGVLIFFAIIISQLFGAHAISSIGGFNALLFSA